MQLHEIRACFMQSLLVLQFVSNMKASFCIIHVAYCCYLAFALSEESSRDNVRTQGNALNEKNQLEFDALQKLHIHLDDDKNGDVDVSESQEFLQEELKVEDQKRHSKFHSGDGSISVNDLWIAWQKSEVSKWSPDEVADWLINIVHLPHYAEVFKNNQIDGHYLPRLASQDDGILLNELKISSTIDRKKIALRAMDVVLFGAPRSNALNEKNQLEFDALQKLHIHLDDDKNGDVDVSESQEFLQEELKVEYQKRHSKFHSGDGSISVNDLWIAWQKSEVSKWSPDEVADWLINIVQLPHYAEVFKNNQIDGHYLPRLASQDDGILLNELKISSTIDRKKIALRAMDVVLFGAPRRHNYLKDLVLGLVVLVAMAGFWFSNVQKRKAQKQMESMMKDVEYLQDAEKNLSNLQNRLQEAEASHQVIQQEKFQLESNLKDEIGTAKREAQRLREAREDHSEEIHTRLKLAEQELVQVREALRKAEKEVEYMSTGMSSSLQNWLQVTYQKEVKNFQYRRNVALRKMEEAKDACYRLKRKRTSVLGALRLAHDQNIDDVDQRILTARTSLAEVTSDLEELQYRWQQIETCCRFDLGVCTSFLYGDDTPHTSAQLMSGKVTAPGTACSNSRESIPIHRVYTYPSFQPVDQNAPPPYHGLSKSTIERHCSAPSGSSSNASVLNTSYDFEVNENGINVEQKTSDVNSDAGEEYTDGSFNGHYAESEHSLAQSSTSVHNGDENTSKIRKHRTSSKKDLQSLLNAVEKNPGHKKKWWTRGKKHHSEEGDNALETNSVLSSRPRGSLPILSQQ